MQWIWQKVQWTELISTLNWWCVGGQSIWTGNQYLHSIHVDCASTWTCYQRSYHNLKLSICCNGEIVELIPYAKVNHTRIIRDFKVSWGILSLNYDRNIVKIIKRWWKSNEDPISYCNGYWTRQSDCEEGCLIDLQIGRRYWLKNNSSITRTLWTYNSVGNKKLGIIWIRSRCRWCRHGKKNVFCHEHIISIEIGCPWTRHTKYRDIVCTTNLNNSGALGNDNLIWSKTEPTSEGCTWNSAINEIIFIPYIFRIISREIDNPYGILSDDLVLINDCELQFLL